MRRRINFRKEHKMEEKFLEFQQAENGEAELLIYGPIRKQSLTERVWKIEADDGRVDALSFDERLKAIESKRLTVRINSYGGSVSEGLAIYNALKNSGKQIKTVCDGFACSIASVIFCAGEERVMPNTSLLMIHNAWTEGGDGNANHFRKLAEDLDKITQPSVNAYAAVSNLSEEEIKDLMDQETWITSEQALEWGFATNVKKDDDAYQELQQDQVLRLVRSNEQMTSKIKTLEAKLEKVTSEPANSWSHFFK